jgi:DNA helicase-2/ATP-dependent DNA helicase PcrA
MATPTTTHLEKLNAQQKRAASYGQPQDGKGFRSGPLLIVAGAGTGKTNTLAHRVAHLIIHGVDPARILMLTFTRRAAIEMRRRAREIVKSALEDSTGTRGHSIVQRLSWGGTFHSIANRLLRHYAQHLRLDPQFTVLDRGDAADLLDVVRQDLGLAAKEQRFPRKDTCLAIYSHRVNTKLSLADALQAQFPWCKSWEADLTRLFRSYVERKQKLSLLDYDDLLLYWHIMMSDARLASHVARHYDHVLVDEYQDTNVLQAEILYALCPDGTGLTVVGDDAQAIYSFRAATVENILRFPDQFKPRAEVITLTQNYRSTQCVLDTANALMAAAPRQFRKYLLSVRGEGTEPRYVTVDDLPSQAEFVALEVLRRREANVPLRRQAVLFRNGSDSDLLELELSKRKIPFVKYGGLRFLEAAHVKDLLAVLRWADNPRNEMAGFRSVQLLPGIGPANARKVLDHLAANSHSFASLQGLTPPVDSAPVWSRFVELLGVLTTPGRPWPGQVRLVRDWYKPQLERLYDHSHTRIGDLDQIELLSTQYSTRDRFLAELTLDPPQASSDLAAEPHLDEDYLVLSTVHSAKGMEWDAVYVLNVVDGSFPSEFAAGKDELLEEERRLLYVAITRSKDNLALISPLKFAVTSQARRSDAHVFGGRSRFMSEQVLSTMEPLVFHGSHASEDALADGAPASLNPGDKIREMW